MLKVKSRWEGNYDKKKGEKTSQNPRSLQAVFLTDRGGITPIKRNEDERYKYENRM